MAQQAKKKSVRSRQRLERKSDKSDPPSAAHELRLKQLEHERDAALSQLSCAEKRIAELETVQDQVVNRIDWVLDSLHSLRDEAS